MIGYQCDENGYLLYEFELQLDVLLTQANCGTKHYFIPQFATDKTPPHDVEFKIRRFLNNIWIYEDDYRGSIVYQDEDQMVITTVGSLPEGWSLDETTEILARKGRDRAKEIIKREIENLTVYVDGYIFDVNVNSLSIMSFIIHSLEISNKERYTGWIMADNYYLSDIHIELLKKALVKGSEALGELYKKMQYL